MSSETATATTITEKKNNSNEMKQPTTNFSLHFFEVIVLANFFVKFIHFIIKWNYADNKINLNAFFPPHIYNTHHFVWVRITLFQFSNLYSIQMNESTLCTIECTYFIMKLTECVSITQQSLHESRFFRSLFVLEHSLLSFDFNKLSQNCWFNMLN